MLARVAESLYWIGRNIERADHTARFLKVQYFSTLDTPMLRNKDFTLRSIMFMAGSNYQVQGELVEKEVWKNVIFDINNSNTLFSIIKNARENARSIRNSISTELWESINKLYLLCSQYDEQRFGSGDLFNFSEDMKSNISVIKSNITNTILHDDCYHFICMGIYIERALQALRIVRNKISDWMILSNNGENRPLVAYQWTILLKSLEAYDIYNKLWPGKKTKMNIFKLIFENEQFPRSIAFSLAHINSSISTISVKPDGFEELMDYFNSRLVEVAKFESFDNEDKIIDHIDDSYESIAKIHSDINKMYFN
jgi:uncharacterized alpha-E superfamily protein